MVQLTAACTIADSIWSAEMDVPALSNLFVEAVGSGVRPESAWEVSAHRPCGMEFVSHLARSGVKNSIGACCSHSGLLPVVKGLRPSPVSGKLLGVRGLGG
jgi:hypothetical protein